jgi:hypothetical protein
MQLSTREITHIERGGLGEMKGDDLPLWRLHHGISSRYN